MLWMHRFTGWLADSFTQQELAEQPAHGCSIEIRHGDAGGGGPGKQCFRDDSCRNCACLVDSPASIEVGPHVQRGRTIFQLAVERDTFIRTPGPMLIRPT